MAATTTYRQLFEESLDNWVSKGSGLTAVFDLIHRDRDVWLFFFVRWLAEQLFECGKCGGRFELESVDELGAMRGVVCPACRKLG